MSHSVFLTNWCGNSLVGDSKLVTIFECCHQHISSPTSISHLTYNGHFQAKKTSATLGFLTDIDEVVNYNILKMWKLKIFEFELFEFSVEFFTKINVFYKNFFLLDNPFYIQGLSF